MPSFSRTFPLNGTWVYLNGGDTIASATIASATLAPESGGEGEPMLLTPLGIRAEAWKLSPASELAPGETYTITTTLEDGEVLQFPHTAGEVVDTTPPEAVRIRLGPPVPTGICNGITGGSLSVEGLMDGPNRRRTSRSKTAAGGAPWAPAFLVLSALLLIRRRRV